MLAIVTSSGPNQRLNTIKFISCLDNSPSVPIQGGFYAIDDSEIQAPFLFSLSHL